VCVCVCVCVCEVILAIIKSVDNIENYLVFSLKKSQYVKKENNRFY